MPSAARYGTLLAIPAPIGEPIVERPRGGSNRASSPTGIRIGESKHCVDYTGRQRGPLWNARVVVAMESAADYTSPHRGARCGTPMWW